MFETIKICNAHSRHTAVSGFNTDPGDTYLRFLKSILWSKTRSRIDDRKVGATINTDLGYIIPTTQVIRLRDRVDGAV